MLDFDHDEWGWKNLKNSKISELLEKLRYYETRTWKEIDSNHKRDHPVELGKLEKAAQKRLVQLNYDDIDQLYRIRLSGKERIWGQRERHILKIIWWDPEHTVCPSALRNT